MTLAQRVGEYVRACFTGLWIESHEHSEVLLALADLCQREEWTLASWDIDQGLQTTRNGHELQASDPLAAIRVLNSLATPAGTTLLVLENFHRFLQSAEIVQALSQQIMAGKQNRTFVIVLSPVIQIPVELEKLFVVLEHELPDRNQLQEIAAGIATEEGELPEGGELQKVLDAASGLSRFEAEGAYSLSLIRQACLVPEVIWELKTQSLKKSGLLSLYRGSDNFETLGGLAALKAFCKRALLRSERNNSQVRARGVLLLSPPGCGKSQFCKALGQEVGRPVLILDVGSLMGSLVGQSEERTRQALQTVDAMAPCLLMIDEIEKAFAGVNGQGDSGVASRMFGTFLTWLNDHQSDVFVVATSNDMGKLPPEFGRSERFDGLFFVDLPGPAERVHIWNIYLQTYGIEAGQARPDDTNWTGAEIKACCRLATLLELPLVEAAQNVVPVAVTARESLTRLRNWASGRCLDAEQGGIYQHVSPPSKRGTRRSVRRDPSNN